MSLPFVPEDSYELQLIRNYNCHFPLCPSDLHSKRLLSPTCILSEYSKSENKLPLFCTKPDSFCAERQSRLLSCWPNPSLIPTQIDNYKLVSEPKNHLFSYSAYLAGLKKHRSEKKSTPDEQKDEKYFERRRRNNQAAKKSRDARKIREDQVALKAAILEHENAILKAQLLTLKDEASAMRRLLLDSKTFHFSSTKTIPP